jgi:hypothetical protein
MTDQLKPLPCPFCGLDSPENPESMWRVHIAQEGAMLFAICLRCMARGPRGWSKAEALRLWNQRASCEDKGETG